MPLRRIRARSELLEKILSALKEAEAEGVKDPLSVLKKAIDKRVRFKSETSRHKNKK
jgi:hypothetical protein